MSLFTGSGVALITPFNKDGVDFAALEKILDYQLENGTNAIFVLGTTGEPSTMTAQEREQVIRFAIKHVNKRVPVIVGSGSNSTAEACAKSAKAQQLGADGLLVVTPYYNKCTQNGLVEHYKAVCSCVDIPVIAYNVPTRTRVNINPDTAKRLCDIKNISGLKEASGDIDQIQAVAAAIEGGMDFYIGDDSLTTIAFCLGAKGVISVAANVIPHIMSKLTSLCSAGNYAQAKALQFQLIPFMSALFSEVNPIPAKKAMSFIGLDCGIPRLPLTEMEKENADKMYAVMKKLQFIK